MLLKIVKKVGAQTVIQLGSGKRINQKKEKGEGK